jgi:hypothetical protein
MVYLKQVKPGIIIFSIYRVELAPRNNRFVTVNRSYNDARQHSESLHGIMPGLIFV